MPVGQMLSAMSSAELTEWMAFARLEPFGAQVEDYRAGLYSSLKANAYRDGKPPLSPVDFFPWNAEPEADTPKRDATQQIIELFDQASQREKLGG